MDCKETRVDMRIPNPDGSKENIRAAQVMFKLNHTMPFTDEYNASFSVIISAMEAILPLR